MKTYIRMDECPFKAGDRVRDLYDKEKSREGTVIGVEEEYVWLSFDDGSSSYRTWTHDLDRLFHKSGGGLTRLSKGELIPAS